MSDQNNKPTQNTLKVEKTESGQVKVTTEYHSPTYNHSSDNKFNNYRVLRPNPAASRYRERKRERNGTQNCKYIIFY